jgi:hypothetical protein
VTGIEKLSEVAARGPDDVIIAYRVGEVWYTGWSDMDAGGLCLGLRLLNIEVDQAIMNQLPSEEDEGIQADG